MLRCRTSTPRRRASSAKGVSFRIGDHGTSPPRRERVSLRSSMSLYTGGVARRSTAVLEWPRRLSVAEQTRIPFEERRAKENLAFLVVKFLKAYVAFERIHAAFRERGTVGPPRAGARARGDPRLRPEGDRARALPRPRGPARRAGTEARGTREPADVPRGEGIDRDARDRLLHRHGLPPARHPEGIPLPAPPLRARRGRREVGSGRHRGGRPHGRTTPSAPRRPASWRTCARSPRSAGSSAPRPRP